MEVEGQIDGEGPGRCFGANLRSRVIRRALEFHARDMPLLTELGSLVLPWLSRKAEWRSAGARPGHLCLPWNLDLGASLDLGAWDLELQTAG